MKHVKISTKLPLDNYVNKETGELLSSELNQDTQLTITKSTGTVIVESDDYFIIDIKTLTQLRKHGIIKPLDEARLLTMCMTLKTEYNATYNHNIPHTMETLSHLVGLSYDKTTVFVKRMHAANVIHKYVTANETLYCVNPFLGRRRKTISKELAELFNKFPVMLPNKKKTITKLPKP